MNKDFREFLKDGLYKVKKLNEDMLTGYGEGVYDTYAYVLRKYDEFHKPVVIPDFVAEWIESPDRDLDDMYIWESPKDVYEWTFGKGDSIENSRLKDLVEAITNGYEVEDEQKYYVMNEENELILGWSQSAYMTPCIEAYEYMKHNGRENLFQLTEQEIKDYDERYLPFMVPINEVNSD